MDWKNNISNDYYAIMNRKKNAQKVFLKKGKISRIFINLNNLHILFHSNFAYTS